jgi:SAM-dependent methyltransferase
MNQETAGGTGDGREEVGAAAARWKADLESWAIPDEILRKAPEPPWAYSARLFAKAAAAAVAQTEMSPSARRALEALGEGGDVLDVGAGGGAASLPLAPPASLLVAVDEHAGMLASFAEAASERSVRHREILGRWPEVSGDVPDADVVVCHHVLYNVGDVVPFLRALNEHARRRVVVELTETHPLSNLSPLWLLIHGLVRPTRPTASDAVAVMSELGFEVHIEHYERPSSWRDESLADRVGEERRRLCVGPDRDAEIAAYFGRAGLGGGTAEETRALATLWWDKRDGPTSP